MEKNFSLTKEQFGGFIENIKMFDEKQARLNKVLGEVFEDSVVYPFLEYESKMVDLLKIVMHDKGDIIEYFIYETNYGQDADEYFITLPEGREVHMYTTDDLYDYLLELYISEIE